jgi:rfaE bifunctional protein kinase chain/domain
MMLIERERARQIIFDFRDQEILVIGDSMLDQWVWGKVNRISPEAPVPVVEVDYFSYSPGGAANVVNNLCSLGARTTLVSVVGADDFGVKLKEELHGRGVDVSGILVDAGRPTTTKTRIIAHNQQVVRTDLERRDKLSDELSAKVIEFLEGQLSRFKMVVISDYNKGFLGEKVVDYIIKSVKSRGTYLVVGPKPENLKLFKGATILTLNEKEALNAVNGHVSDRESLEKIGAEVLKEYENEAILITRGEKGMSLFARSGEAFHIPALASEVFDVSGAGDTVLSVMALSLCSGAQFREATVLSNFAAAVVVKKIGTATLSISELIDIIDKQHLSINY